jgi:DNA-binding response OmpR family regulator
LQPATYGRAAFTLTHSVQSNQQLGTVPATVFGVKRCKRVLIVDDERNIRLTVARALEPLDIEIDEAVNGEEALEKLGSRKHDLMLLDLRLPGIDGLEVLRRLRQARRQTRVLIITAYGTVDGAVEAMKLGAVDFVQKPFAPEEIRGLVAAALRRAEAPPPPPPRAQSAQTDYRTALEHARAAIEIMRFDQAEPWAVAAAAADVSRPEAFNLLGAIKEILGETLAAQKYYRAALALDPTYGPAQHNLTRATTLDTRGSIDVGAKPGSHGRSER